MIRKAWGFGSLAAVGAFFAAGCFGQTSNVGAEDPDAEGGADTGTGGSAGTTGGTGTGGNAGTAGTTSTGGNAGSPPGECEPGETKPAGDTCNTCTCNNDGEWICTRSACNECSPGETRPAGDDCNTCMCIDGHWACTMKLCCEPGTMVPSSDGCNWCECTENGVKGECTERGCGMCPAPLDDAEGEPAPDPPLCPAVPVYAKGPGSYTCCPYGDACSAPEGWDQFGSLEECLLAYEQCEPDTVSCDGDADNGCETDIANDAQNCGACGLVCDAPHATPLCNAGACAFDCDAGWLECNGNTDDGCETAGTECDGE